MNRRDFFCQTIMAGAAVSIGAATRAAAKSEAASAPPKSAPDVIVYRGTYPGWPWVARVGKDRLVCVFREGTRHGFSPVGKVLWTESRDGGKTWSLAQVVADKQGVDDRNAAVALLPDGAWMVCYNTYDNKGVSRCMVTTSKDGGTTWSAPRPVTALDARTRAAPIALSCGEILVPIYSKTSRGRSTFAARSADGGKTWGASRIPNSKEFAGDEWSALEVEAGRIIGIHRNTHGRDGCFWKSESRDGGRTWDEAVRTNVRDAGGISPAQLDLHGKTPVLTYDDRRMISVSMVTTKDPQFVTWDLEGRLPCYRYRSDGKPITDAGYPASVAVGKNSRFIVDYEIRPEGKWIAGYFVDLPTHWQ